MNTRFVAIVTVVILATLALVEWRPWAKKGVDATSVSVASLVERSGESRGEVTTVPPVVVASTAPNNTPRQLVSSVVVAEKSEAPKQAIRAQLSPVQFTSIVSEINGKISELSVREGETFSRGQLLVSFDCALQEAQLQKVKAQMQIAQRKYDTNRKLLDRGAVSKVETENSASELDRASAEVKELTILLSKCRIEAPYKGKVVEQKVRALQFVQAGQPLMEILDNSLMELEFIAPSAWMSWIKPGEKFQISIDETNKSYPAQVTRIGAKIDSVSQTVKVAAVIDGEFPELSPGMSGTVNIEAALK